MRPPPWIRQAPPSCCANPHGTSSSNRTQRRGSQGCHSEPTRGTAPRVGRKAFLSKGLLPIILDIWILIAILSLSALELPLLYRFPRYESVAPRGVPTVFVPPLHNSRRRLQKSTGIRVVIAPTTVCGSCSMCRADSHSRPAAVVRGRGQLAVTLSEFSWSAALCNGHTRLRGVSFKLEGGTGIMTRRRANTNRCAPYRQMVRQGEALLQHINPHAQPEDANCPETADAVNDFFNSARVRTVRTASPTADFNFTSDLGWTNVRLNDLVGRLADCTHVVVRGIRNPPVQGVTPEHYFVVFKVDNVVWVADAFNPILTRDVQGYVNSERMTRFEIPSRGEYDVDISNPLAGL